MGFWQRFMPAGKNNNTSSGETTSKPRRFAGTRRVLGKIFRGNKKGRRVDIQPDEPSTFPGPEPQDVLFTTSIPPDRTPSIVASACDAEVGDDPVVMVEELSPVEGADGIHQAGLGQEIKGQKLPTVGGADGHEIITTTDDAGPSHNRVTAQEVDSDQASTKSNNNRTWELVVAMQKESHERDLMDYREEQEDLLAQHQRDMEVANGRILHLQKRLMKLAAAMPSNHRLRSSSSSNLRQENTQLCVSIATVGLENRELKTTLGNAERDGEDLESQLAELLESQRALAKDLQEAHHEAEMCFSRMHWINYDLENQQGIEELPAKYVDPNLELELRDARYAELVTSSAINLRSLRELMIRAKAFKAAARLKIASLKADLEAREQRRASLEASKEIFQRQCEEVFEELGSRIPTSDISTAMIELFQLAVADNHAIQTKIRDQRRDISLDKDNIKLLSHDIKTLKRRSSWAKKNQLELEDRIRAHDIEVGRLEFKLGCVQEEHTREMKSRDHTLAELIAQHEALSHELEVLAHPSVDADVQALLLHKSNQLADLRNTVSDLRDENSYLQEEQQAHDEVAADTAVKACASERELEELKTRLSAATEEIASLRARLGK
ncbi:hypothetical protein MMC07_006314 [Pseudocyphellaria aurata]|nr:hypothetical protein [Pseudocyphellaria aurata]